MDKLIRTLKAISVKRLEDGEIGFLTTEPGEETKWYNVKAPVDALDLLLKDTIVKGNTIEFEVEKGVLSNFTLKAKGSPQKSGDKKNWAENIVNLDQLLDSAHAQGIISITTELVSIDYTTKRAVFKANVTGWLPEIQDKDKKILVEKRIGTFTGVGDSEAIDDKVQGISDAWIRMSETRAIVRALRWYTNNAGVAEEELPKEEKKIPTQTQVKKNIITVLSARPDESFAIESIPKLIKATDEETNAEIQNLLEEGIIFEPKAGYIKYLG